MEQVGCLCGAKSGIIVAERDRWGLPVQFVLCPECGLLRTSPRLAASELPIFYERDYRRLMDGKVVPDQAIFDLQRNRGSEALSFVSGLVELGPKTEVHEIGCSAGGVLSVFADAGCRTAGVDYDESFVHYGRRRGLDLRHGEMECLNDRPPPDLIILSHVLEHSNDPAGMLRAVMRRLAPQGKLFIAVPGLEGIPQDYQSNLLLYFQICHTYHFSAQTLCALVEKTNAEVLKIDKSARLLAQSREEMKNETRRALDSPVASVLSHLRSLEADWQRESGFWRMRQRMKLAARWLCRGDSNL